MSEVFFIGLLIIFILSIVPIYALFFIIIPFFFGAGYEGSTTVVVKKILKYSKARRGERFVDLGSGDGRLVIAFAQKGIESHGYEINPFLVFYSRRKIRKLGLSKRAFIHWKNFWKEDLSKFNIVYCFQISYLMPKLQNKLQRELPKGSRVISNTWPFPGWPLVKKDEDVFVYEK